MENKGIKIFAIAILFVIVLCLTIAYASLSQTLSISGTAEVDGGTWDVHFEDISKSEHGATVTYEMGQTSISNMSIVFSKPGDYVDLTITVINNGTIPAKLVDVVDKGTTLTFEGSGATPDVDITKVQNDVKYTVKYENQDITASTDVSKLLNTTIAATKTATITLHAEYIEQSSNQESPMSDVTVKGFDRTFEFKQA